MPVKIIVAIGGGERGKVKKDGTRTPYELRPMDAEIVKLTGKAKPHILYLGQAQRDPEGQRKDYAVFSEKYTKLWHSVTKMLSDEAVLSGEGAAEALEWADAVYVGGGDTVHMIDFWRANGFDEKLKSFWESGKILAGTSAGANCWFDYYCTDCFKDENGNSGIAEGLGFMRGLFVPHSDQPTRIPGARHFLESHPGVTAYYASNVAAFVFEDESYRTITGDASFHNGAEAFARVEKP